jgi:hypothetical protein
MIRTRLNSSIDLIEEKKRNNHVEREQHMKANGPEEKTVSRGNKLTMLDRLWQISLGKGRKSTII